MNSGKFQQITWLDPWYAISSESSLHAEIELRREIIREHPLYGVKVKAVARREDCDDYLFFLPDNPFPLAVVHLTYQRETTPNFPHTTFYSSLSDWIENDMKVTHLDYIEDGDEEL